MAELTARTVAGAIGVKLDVLYRRLRAAGPGTVRLEQGYVAVREREDARWSFSHGASPDALPVDRYDATLRALRALCSGSHYEAGDLFGDAEWGEGTMAALRSAGAVSEVAGRWCVREHRKLQAFLDDEEAFCSLLGWADAFHFANALVLSNPKSSLRRRCLAFAAMHERLGYRLARSRFGVEARVAGGLRAGSDLDETVVAAVERAELSDFKTAILLYGLKRAAAAPEVQLAAVGIVAASGCGHREIDSFCSLLAEGHPLEAAATESGVVPVPVEGEVPEVEPEATPEDDPVPSDADVLAAVLKCASACVDLSVESRNLLLELKPRIDYLAKELGYGREGK